MFAFLKATTGSLAGTTFDLGLRALVGRAGDADIQLTEGAVSRRHALILRLDDGRYWIGDLASTNGTFLRERRIDNHCLRSGDVIHLGKTTLVFEEMLRPDAVNKSCQEQDLHLLSGPVEKQTYGVSLRRLRKNWYDKNDSGWTGEPDTTPLDLTAASAQVSSHRPQASWSDSPSPFPSGLGGYL